jgi:porin
MWVRALRQTALVAAVLTASPARAQEPAPTVALAGSYVSDSFTNVQGGIRRGFRQMGLLELSAEVNGAGLGFDGVQGFASLQGVHGKSLSGDLVGDAQVVSNIDAPDGLRLFEAWLSVPIGSNGYAKAGLIDLNGEFDVQTVGAMFLNSSHGIGPDFSQTGLNGPSIFPTTSTALIGGWNGEGWSARAGVFDAISGDPDRPSRTIVRLPGTSGLLMVGEAEVNLGRNAQLQVGAWRYTSKFQTIIPDENDLALERRGNQGAYAMVEGQFGKLANAPFTAWVRTGVAETAFNPIGVYVGGGLAVGEERSRLGLALAHARLGRPALQAISSGPRRAETIIELTYSRAVGEKLVVQPDVQYVINPGFEPGLGNALVAGIRLQLELF